jgi:hypothetical protein
MVGTYRENKGSKKHMGKIEVGTEVGTEGGGGAVLPRARALWPVEALALLAERVAIMLDGAEGADEAEVVTWAEEVVRVYWSVLAGGLDPERARVERLGERPWPEED